MSNDRWNKYYELTDGRAPRKLLVRAMPSVQGRGIALDLGAGDLADSVFLLNEGFSVTAVDSSSASESMAKKIALTDFIFIKSKFEDFNFEKNKYNLVSAQLSLPFIEPAMFGSTFFRLKESIKTEGIFVGHFFGINDEWNTSGTAMTFHKKADIEELFSDMSIIDLSETETEGKTASGNNKHWHLFEVIARKI